MEKVLGRLAAATLLFRSAHSLLASHPAKEAAAGVFGERRRNAFYRLFYQAFALGSFGALGVYAARLPDRELYRASRPVAGLLRLGQAVPIQPARLELLDSTDLLADAPDDRAAAALQRAHHSLHSPRLPPRGVPPAGEVWGRLRRL